jgi:hypothetical protein
MANLDPKYLDALLNFEALRRECQTVETCRILDSIADLDNITELVQGVTTLVRLCGSDAVPTIIHGVMEYAIYHLLKKQRE